MQQYDTLGIFVGISAFHISVFPLFIFAHTRQIKKELGNINSNSQQLFHFNTQNRENKEKDDKKNEYINAGWCRKSATLGILYSKILDCLHTAICVHKQQHQQLQ